jgi:hypothetical protein
MSTPLKNTLPEDYVHSGEEHRGPGPETGGLPGSTARTRSRTNLVSQAPRGGLIGKPGEAFRRSAAKREAFGSYPALNPPLNPTLNPVQPAVPRQARRKDDAVARPANPSALGQQRAVTGTVRKPLNPWPVVASLGGTIAMAVLCVMFWPTARDSNPAASAAPAARAAAELSTSQRRDELPADPDAALTTALDDLGAALDAAAEGSQEEILRKVSTPGQDCRMVWAKDSPSLVFGRYPIRANSLAHTLEACAQAILRMH